MSHLEHAAGHALERNLLQHMTAGELRRTRESRPDLFDGPQVTASPLDGWTLTALAAACEADATIDDLDRAKLRAKLGLRAVDCGADQQARGCQCLTQAIDAALRGDHAQTKAAITAAALDAHQEPEPPELLSGPTPRETTEDPPEPVRASEASGSEPALAPEPTPERPFRVVRRTERWFDPPSRSPYHLMF